MTRIVLKSCYSIYIRLWEIDYGGQLMSEPLGDGRRSRTQDSQDYRQLAACLEMWLKVRLPRQSIFISQRKWRLEKETWRRLGRGRPCAAHQLKVPRCAKGPQTPRAGRLQLLFIHQDGFGRLLSAGRLLRHNGRVVLFFIFLRETCYKCPVSGCSGHCTLRFWRLPRGWNVFQNIAWLLG